MHKDKNISSELNVNWMKISCSSSSDTHTFKAIEQQIAQSRREKQCLLFEVKPGIFLLTIPEPNNNALLTIKKISDRVQYSILPERLNNDNLFKLSYFHLRNLCHLEGECSWAKSLANEEQESSRIHAIFFYHLKPLMSSFTESLLKNGLHIKDLISNRLLMVSDSNYIYPYNLAMIPALSLWRQKSTAEIIASELTLLLKRFSLFSKISHELFKVEELNWTLKNGSLNYILNGEEKTFDYPTICDDIIHAQEEQRIAKYLQSFQVNDLNCINSFPTISVRSLVHLRARPNALSSLEKGYALCAALENNGKQKPIESNNANKNFAFTTWFKRVNRHLNRHQYQARVVLSDDKSPTALSLVGDQITTIAVFPSLLKGVLEQLHLSFKGGIRLIAHSEDVLTIASADASWNEINDVNHKATTLFKMISSDGADPLSLFTQVNLPTHGVGSFHLSLVPGEYFELINTAVGLKHSLPPGHDHYLLGLSYECLHEWNLAVEEFQKALRLDSKDSSILTALGSSLMELGNLEQALPFDV